MCCTNFSNIRIKIHFSLNSLLSPSSFKMSFLAFFFLDPPQTSPFQIRKIRIEPPSKRHPMFSCVFLTVIRNRALRCHHCIFSCCGKWVGLSVFRMLTWPSLYFCLCSLFHLFFFLHPFIHLLYKVVFSSLSSPPFPASIFPFSIPAISSELPAFSFT